MAKSIDARHIQQATSVPANDNQSSTSSQRQAYHIDHEEYDILSRLYKIEKKYDKSFEYLILMKSTQAFDFLGDFPYPGFHAQQKLNEYFTKLIQIDA